MCFFLQLIHLFLWSLTAVTADSSAHSQKDCIWSWCRNKSEIGLMSDASPVWCSETKTTLKFHVLVHWPIGTVELSAKTSNNASSATKCAVRFRLFTIMFGLCLLFLKSGDWMHVRNCCLLNCLHCCVVFCYVFTQTACSRCVPWVATRLRNSSGKPNKPNMRRTRLLMWSCCRNYR